MTSMLETLIGLAIAAGLVIASLLSIVIMLYVGALVLAIPSHLARTIRRLLLYDPFASTEKNEERQRLMFHLGAAHSARLADIIGLSLQELRELHDMLHLVEQGADEAGAREGDYEGSERFSQARGTRLQ